MTPAELFLSQKYLHLKDVLPKEICHYLTHFLLLAPDLGYGTDPAKDIQVPTAKAVIDHEVIFETLLEKIWPSLEDVLGEELIPTYAFARLYSNGDVLEPHVDKNACEISISIQLGRSHHYAWPIYMGGKRVDMAEGDGVMYLGREIEHWRSRCDGPEGYYSGQVFLHYVRKNGEFAMEAGDMNSKNSDGSYVRQQRNIRFVKNREYLMVQK